jgi:hypothetical protein
MSLMRRRVDFGARMSVATSAALAAADGPFDEPGAASAPGDARRIDRLSVNGQVIGERGIAELRE